VTSRAVLHVQGEQEFPVPALAVPDLVHLPEREALTEYAAVALFLQRARAVKPDFQLTQANAHAVAAICTRVDGLPLAIELAAARSKLLPPAALLARLEHRLAVLTGGAQNLPARQQTLRNTIEWSYQLLDTAEQRLFRRLSVFVGGCTLEAIESVCAALGDEAGPVLDGVTSLLDKSLLQPTEYEAEEPRLLMLETIREYGVECLRERAEAEASQRAHALYYLALAEEAEPQLKGAQQVPWWRRLEREQENLRAALSWLIGQDEGELALRMSGALWWFWNIRGYWSEGDRWLNAVLGLSRAQARTAKRAKVLFGADTFAWRLGHPVDRSLLEESVSIYRELGDNQGLAEVLSWVGLSRTYQSNLAAARMPLEESVALAREVGNPWLLAKTLRSLGHFMNRLGDVKSAGHFLEKSVTLYREVKDQRELSFSLRLLSEAARCEENLAQATALAQESLALARELEDVPDTIRSLNWLASTKALRGDAEQVVDLCEESLALARGLGEKLQIADTLLRLGGVFLYKRDLPRTERYAQESLMLFRERRDKDGIALALCLLGEVRLLQGDLRQARVLCTEAVLVAREAEGSYCIGYSLIILAKVTAAEGQAEQAVSLFGAAESRIDLGSELDQFERADYERAVTEVRARLGEEAFATAWAEGRNMTPEQVLAALEPTMATSSTPTGPSSIPPGKTLATYPDGLTAHEVEVLRLVARGLTNEQVARQLGMSSRSVKTNLTSIYGKIQVSSRIAATRYAIEHQFF
jgi:predicted ATPase/DNA-binding CsgD family transcriptional regulator